MKTLVRLNAEEVKAVFDTATDQGDALVALYRMAFGSEWDRIEKLDGWPTCNQYTSAAICKMFMDFDERRTPGCGTFPRSVMPGGIWLNNGFSTLNTEGLKNWQVRLCGYTVQPAGKEMAA